MQIRITLDQVIEWAANAYIDQVEPEMIASRRERVLPVEKFNIVARAFSTSTILLVMSAVSSFFAIGSALFYLGFGLGLRKIAGDEREKYLLLAPPMGNVTEVLRRAASAAASALSGLGQDSHLFVKLGIDPPRSWNETKWYLNIFGIDFWQSTVPWPRG